jgi:hypothetical protein
MKTRKLAFILVLITGFSFLYTACTKEEDPEPSNTQEETVDATKDDALADKLFSELTDITDEAMRNQDKSYKNMVLDTIFMGPCVTVTLDTLAFPFTITLDFGSENCLCNDNKWRRGKIHVEHSGPYWAAGTVITTTLENYFVNEYQLTGEKVVTNQGLNTAGNPTWTVQVDGQVIKPNGEGTITWVANRMREWSEGHNTIFLWWDDVYLISGTHEVVASNGSTLSAVTIQPLEFALNCYWIRSGVVNFQHSDLPLIILDYGDGSCDKYATVTINGSTYEITL